VRQWNIADGKLLRVFEGHRDALYSLAVFPDGGTIATGSYYQKIKLWKIATGEELRLFLATMACVFDLASGPTAKSWQRQRRSHMKLWDVASGERRDTLAQSLERAL